MPHIILASTSRYRRELLAQARAALRDASARRRARTPSTGESPGGDGRAARPREGPEHRASADALVIGSDQVASLDGRLLRKPGSREVAVAQLRACQGKTVLFHTAVAVIATDSRRDAASTSTAPRCSSGVSTSPRSNSTCGSSARSTAPAASRPKGSESRCSSRSRRRTRRRSSACR